MQMDALLLHHSSEHSQENGGCGGQGKFIFNLAKPCKHTHHLIPKRPGFCTHKMGVAKKCAY